MKANSCEMNESRWGSLQSPQKGVRNITSGSKNFIGMTLKEYINSKDAKESIEEIEEEQSQSMLTASPAFHDSPPPRNAALKGQSKVKQKQELLTIVNNILHQPQAKIPKINLEEYTNFNKNSQKLPAIPQQRSTVKSRNAISKDQYQQIKKQRCHTLKTQQIQMINQTNSTLRKNNEKIKFNDLDKHSVDMKKIPRPRIISTSFYHMQLKEKDRMKVKTEENVLNKHLENVFMITRYKESSLHKKKQEENIFKKH